MTPLFRKLHKWLGLIIGLQLVLWLISGLVMSLLDSDKVAGKALRAPAAAAQLWPSDAIPYPDLMRIAPGDTKSIKTDWLAGIPVFQIATETGHEIRDARTGKVLALDSAIAAAIAKSHYNGPGTVGTPKLLNWSDEARSHEGKIWRVDYADAEETTAYISAVNGELLEMRNRDWRMFDFFWMFHIMDYADRANFNNPILISSGLGGLFMSIFGIWLLFASFRFADFVPPSLRSKRTVRVVDPSGLLLKEVSVKDGGDLFSGLRKSGVELPSNCGGGQSCGLCVVRVREDSLPATSADRSMLSPDELQRGYRLSCNLPVGRDMCVEVSATSDAWALQTGRVLAIKSIGPYLREITVTPDAAFNANARAGCFIQVHVPEYDISRGELWNAVNGDSNFIDEKLPAQISNRGEMRRSYSLSNIPDSDDGVLRLLVRLTTGSSSSRKPSVGKGSAYIFSRRVGDEISFTGPFGLFRLKDTVRPKVFIGSGAGIGPLRAMVHEQASKEPQSEMTLLAFNRRGERVPYEAEFEALARSLANFEFAAASPHLDKPDASFDESVTAFLRGLTATGTDVHEYEFYICGGPGFIRETRGALKRAGVRDEDIALDDFLV